MDVGSVGVEAFACILKCDILLLKRLQKRLFFGFEEEK